MFITATPSGRRLKGTCSERLASSGKRWGFAQTCSAFVHEIKKETIFCSEHSGPRQNNFRSLRKLQHLVTSAMMPRKHRMKCTSFLAVNAIMPNRDSKVTRCDWCSPGGSCWTKPMSSSSKIGKAINRMIPIERYPRAVADLLPVWEEMKVICVSVDRLGCIPSRARR